MARYYFQIRNNGLLEEDQEGTELASDDAAQLEAIAGAREVVADRVKRGETIGTDAFEVVNERGELIHTLPLRSVLKLT
ncbi:hypothetical protein [Agrobacterium sp. NCPPB 925]|uniref:DUF6894 family protein n=1 Tax=Agrobacterium TaxID=357 RepID=UPI0009BC6A70|nr:conserved hypothetical protein [Agrobacterium sp. NCPPB 925]